MSKQDIRDTIVAYWKELESNKGWIDLGMSMPSTKLFPPAIITAENFLLDMNHRADYQHPAGPHELREEIAKYESLHTRIEYSSDNVMLVGGAFRGFSHIINCLLSETSQLVEIVPTYPSLAGYVRFVAEKYKVKYSTVYPSDNITFQIIYEEVLPFIQPSTILWFTNPNNPLGLYIPHIPQFRERKNRIVNTQDQAGEEPADEELVVPGRAFASVNQHGYARDQCPQNTGTSIAS